MRPTIHAMCGMAFSGKSTLARILAAAREADLISLDAINAARGLDGAAGIPDSEWEKTSALAMDAVRAAVRAGRSTVVDDTFSHRFLRDRVRRVAAEEGARFVLLFVDTPLDVARARRAANEGARTRPGLDAAVFEHHVARFEFPGDDEAPVRIADAAALDAWLAQTAD